MKKNIVLITLIAMCIGSQLQANNGRSIQRQITVEAGSLDSDTSTGQTSLPANAVLIALGIIVFTGQIAPNSLVTTLVEELGSSAGTLRAYVESTQGARALWKLIDFALN